MSRTQHAFLVSAYIGSGMKGECGHVDFTDFTGKKSRPVWLSGMRQEADISEITGRALSFFLDARDSFAGPFGQSPSSSFIPGRAADLASKMSQETHWDKAVRKAL